MKAKFLRIAAMVALMLAAMATGQAQVPITVEQGWNWISYPYSEPMSVAEALSGFTASEGDVLKSQSDGFAQYQNGAWTGSLTMLIPGKGYKYESVDGTVKTFVFGGTANDPSALPEEALDGEFTVDANGTKVRFSPGNLQCRVDPTQEKQATMGTGTSTMTIMPYNTYYNYSLCQMIYKAEELAMAGVGPGPITSIAFESYTSYHYLRSGITIWLSTTSLTEAPSTSVITAGMTEVFSGSLIQQDGWTPVYFSTPFTWDGTSNLMVTVVMNHGSYNSSTSWRGSNLGFTCCNYKYNDSNAYDPSSTTYSMYTISSRPNTRFNGKGGVTWRFAEKQWDYIGEGNANVSSSYTGWIDMFGWGTSGHPHRAKCWQPWSYGSSSDFYAYDNVDYGLYDQTGEADWGCNAISNGGNKPNQWRSLTGEEWDYMFNTRSGKRYAKARVNGINGLIVLPDGWQTSYYSLNSTNSASAAYTSNTITTTQWQTLEEHGAVFLPAGGYRMFGNSLYEVDNVGCYWTSSTYQYAYLNATGIWFSDSDLGTEGGGSRSNGNAVRLVCQSNPRIRTLGVTNVTMNSATANADVDDTGSATVTERGVCWNTTFAPTVSNSYQAAGTGTGGFTAQLTNLSAGTTYYMRAYAKIGDTYRYGNELTFTTSSSLSVSTSSVTGITGTFAQCGGTVTGGDQSVTARGVCWSTYSGPTLFDSHTYDGRGEGSFSSIMDNLTAGTTYYVRAYATTADGTFYGNQRSFTASDGVDVTTAVVTNIDNYSAICGGHVDNHGSSNAITARGVCWGTSSYPTVSDNHTIDGTGTGNFVSQLTGLAPGTYYYVRAYATTAQGTTYGGQRAFTTTGSPGLLHGLFSVGDGLQVMFSQGNLQYQASTNTWRFADNQWDDLGASNNNISPTYSGWIDNFGWGTSGYNHGAVCYQPWSTSNNYQDYYAYGNKTYDLCDQTGKADWGYNAISNGGNQTNQWRTLTSGEWFELLHYRNTTSGIRFAMAKVNDKNGLILLPDNWSSSYYTLSDTNNSFGSYSSNIITATQWNTLLQHGAVFLPSMGEYGYYWSASHYVDVPPDVCYSLDVTFPCPSLSGNEYLVHNSYRYSREFVRLVRNAQ